MFSDKLEKSLNQQVKLESAASALYLSMASWCEKKKLNGAASFYYAQSEEERQHMLKVFKYINEMGGHAKVASVDQVDLDFENIRQVVQRSLESEKMVTASVHQLCEVAREEKDYGTLNFLQFYVDEQREEEVLFGNILDRIELIGLEGQGLYYIDKELEALAKQKIKTEGISTGGK
ncbi:MAG: ferritin [Bacteroidetes bacterium]|nr:ferritin [Bacteroidota bacterium]